MIGGFRKCESIRRTQTEHVIYCGREQGHNGPCTFSDGNGMHFWLDAYEINNLREMLKAIDSDPDLRVVFATGDWFHQVKSKVSDGFILPRNPANASAAELVARFHKHVGHRYFLLTNDPIQKTVAVSPPADMTPPTAPNFRPPEPTQ